VPEIDPRAVLPPMTPYYLDEMRRHRIGAVLSARRSRLGRCHQGPCGKNASVLLANHGPVVAGETLEAAVFAMEELEETAKTVSAAARAQSANI